MVGLGDLPGGTANSRATGVSGDGSVAVAVGTSQSASGTEAFRWTSVGGMVGLGDLAGGSFHSTAAAVSADGSIVAGDSSSGSGIQAFVWDAANGMQGLGDLGGGDIQSFALRATRNGSIVVGQGGSFHHRSAFIWDAVHGMRELELVLTFEYGLDLTDWSLISAASISDDGSVIAGWGFNFSEGREEAWVAMPEPPSAAGIGAGTTLLAALGARRRPRAA